jgi:hypothetical protein
VDGAKQPVAFPEVDSGDGSLRPSQGEECLAVHQQILGIVIPNEVRDLQFAAKCGSLTLFGMTTHGGPDRAPLGTTPKSVLTHYHIDFTALARAQQLIS